MRQRPAIPARHRPESRATCFDAADVVEAVGGRCDCTATSTTTHFAITYDPGEPVLTESNITALGETLEHAWTVIIDELGWPEPPGSSAHYVQVLLIDFPPELPWAGYADEGDCDGESVAYVVLNTDYWYTSLQYYRVDPPTHEFFHTSQFATPASFRGRAGGWYLEATAAWMQDRVNDDSDGYLTEWFPLYLDDPYASLDTYRSDTYLQYSHFFWPLYLDERVGGNELVRDTWTEADPEESPYDTFARLLADTELGSFEAHWGGFLASTGGLQYTDQDAMRAAAAARQALDGTTLYQAELTALPAEGAWTEDDDLPESFGASYLHVVLPAHAADSLLRFTLQAEADEGWAAGASVDGQEPVSVLDTGGGALTLDLPLPAEATEAWLGAGPTQDNGGAWTWQVSLIEPEIEDDPEDPKRGCGCATAGPGRWSLLVGLVLGVARREAPKVRRRRRDEANRLA